MISTAMTEASAVKLEDKKTAKVQDSRGSVLSLAVSEKGVRPVQ